MQPKMPKLQEPTQIDEQYTQIWAQKSGKQRLQRMFDLYSEMYRMIAFQIKSKNKHYSDRKLKIEVAKRMYLSDENVQRMLSKLDHADELS